MDRIMKATMIYSGLLDMQVCVPKEYADEEVVKFANSVNPSGICTSQWQIIKEGSKYLNGDPERVQCLDHEENVHMMLDC